MLETHAAHSTALAAYTALQGQWTLRRKLTSFLQGFPSGSFTGTATFTPRPPTDATFSAESLYAEDGDFVMENGLAFKANRRYVYRYHEQKNEITAWFVKDDGNTVDYYFHHLGFEQGQGVVVSNGPAGTATECVMAKGDHLCVKDMYYSTYDFRFREDGGLKTFGIKYEVKGPSKDYISDAWYTR
ncbi:hypothetical protein B0A49_06380 [Cryomyces minteri]|uniref:DUF6314 domain-containing protein n=1 Tax=Cryomyces minteri TaxID=331657 RepID=A0A4U0X5I3_9PEZI|nr:hypothetical protein B0A49_06380 [Cryomyces minteri]